MSVGRWIWLVVALVFALGDSLALVANAWRDPKPGNGPRRLPVIASVAWWWTVVLAEVLTRGDA